MKSFLFIFFTTFSSIVFSHEIKTVIVELNSLDFVSNDLTYGNQMLWVPEIDDEVVASRSVQGFLAK